MMTTFVMSGIPSFGQTLLPQLNENEYDSSSEVGDKMDSDYSLSDIEEGLDDEEEIENSSDEIIAQDAPTAVLPPKRKDVTAGPVENTLKIFKIFG